MSDSAELARPGLGDHAAKLAGACVFRLLQSDELQFLKRTFAQASHDGPEVNRVGDLLDLLDPSELETFLTALIAALPPDDGTVPMWEAPEYWNVRQNLGAWYSTLLFIGRYVHHHSAGADDSLTRRMQGIASESLRWLPGAFLAQVAIYSRSAYGAEQSSYLTALRIPGCFSVTRPLKEELGDFNTDFEHYVTSRGSTIRKNAQIVRSRARSTGRCEAIRLEPEPTYAMSGVLELPLPAGAQTGSRNAYLAKVDALASRLQLPCGEERRRLLDYVQIAAGTESGNLHAREGRSISESSAHLYVVQLKEPGFIGVAGQPDSQRMTHEYYEAFRECLARLALENALDRLSEEQGRRARASAARAARDAETAKIMDDAFRELVAAVEGDLSRLKRRLPAFSPAPRVANFVSHFLNAARSDKSVLVEPWGVHSAHSWQGRPDLWAAALCELAGLTPLSGSGPIELWEERRARYSDGQQASASFVERGLARLGLMRAPLQDLMKVKLTPTWDKGKPHWAAGERNVFLLDDKVLKWAVEWRQAQVDQLTSAPDTKAYSCGELFLAAGLNILSKTVSLYDGVALHPELDWAAFVNGLNDFACSQENQHASEHKWSRARVWRIRIESCRCDDRTAHLPPLHRQLEVTLLPLYHCDNVDDPFAGEATGGEAYYSKACRTPGDRRQSLRKFILTAAVKGRSPANRASTHALHRMLEGLDSFRDGTDDSPELTFHAPSKTAGARGETVAVVGLRDLGSESPRVVLTLMPRE